VDTRQIAVVNESEELTPADVAKGVAAVQKQVATDFAPAWGASAVLSAFPSLDHVPLGYWPVVVRDDIGINDAGVHLSESGDKVFALVLFSGSRWTVTLSHEVLELLVDPFGTRFLPGPSAQDETQEVEYLAEICDPCQADDCAYPVNGDQLVSDFVLPGYYGGAGDGRYSFAGNLTEPRQVLVNGYVTWHDPLTDEWWQALDAGRGLQFRQISADALRPDVHLRGAIDRQTNAVLAAARPAPRKARPAPARKRLLRRMERYAAVTRAQGEWWRKQIDRVSRRPRRTGR
jgi:hypothetical protein